MQAHPDSPTSMPTDAMEQLEQDHREVERMFAEYESLQAAGGGDRERITQLVQQLSAALMLHAALEEEIFYAAVEQLTGDKKDVDHARAEHAEAKRLVQQLTQMTADDARLADAMAALARSVREHVREEEERLFTEARGRIDAQAIGAQMAKRRAEIQQPPEKQAELPVNFTVTGD